ncbi:MAG: HAMP domain-containing histidine kinase [Pirellulaceae bacterium]|nr:HAMP domain-containing histidine kinase [Pirellulaceae bacterium]
MDKKALVAKATARDGGSDFEAVLAAWHDATLQLEHSHEALHQEVRRLTAERDAALDRLEARNRQAELGRMTSRLADELRNQLVPIALNLSLLGRRMADDPLALNLLAKAESGLTTVGAAVGDMASFASDRALRWSEFAVSRLADEVCAALAPRLSAQSIETVIDIPGDQNVLADRDMLRQALTNLAANAVDAMPDGGTLTITSARTEQGLELEVADTGMGLPEATRREMFRPFFSTKSGGAGLGLTIVHHLVEAHGGYVTAVNCPEGGAAFTLCLPQRKLKVAA